MASFKNWAELLDRAIQVALDKLSSKYNTKSNTYKKYKSSFDNYANTHTKSEIKGKFANNLLVLTAAVMKADGRVLKSELDYVKSFFLEQFPKGFASVRIKMLKDVIKADYSYEKATKFILETMPLSQRKFLLEYLFNLAKADGAIVKQEIEIIDRIAALLGYSGIGYANLKARYIKIASKNEYAILGIKKDSTDKQVKKAYRKMAVLHHPDKFAQASKEEQLAAKKKFQKIQKAYEIIKKARGLK